jgi:lysozyme family protein
MLGNWEIALKKGDKGAQKYKKQDIIKAVTAQNKANAKRTYDELVKAIKKKDIRALKSKLRHNQPYSIAIFNQVTGKKLPKTTRDIHSFLDNEFMNESVNEGKGVEKIMKMADDHSFGKLGGRTVDAMTANLFKQVYEKANDKQKEKINKMNEKQLYVFMAKLWSRFGKQVRL